MELLSSFCDTISVLKIGAALALDKEGRKIGHSLRKTELKQSLMWGKNESKWIYVVTSQSRGNNDHCCMDTFTSQLLNHGII